MYMKAKKTWDEFKALKRKKPRRMFHRGICYLFLLVVIVQLLVVLIIYGKRTGMIRGMYAVMKVFNIPRIHRDTLYVKSKGNMINLKTIFPRFDHTFQPIVLSRTKQSRQVSTSTILAPVVTVLQTGKLSSRTKKSRQVSRSTISTPVATVLRTGKVLPRTKQSRQVSTSTIITPLATVLRTGKVLPRTKQSRQLPTSTISTPVATMSQTVTSKMSNFEFYYQYCDWIQRNNLTIVNQMYTNCSKLCPPKPPCLVGLVYTTMDNFTFRDLESKFLMLKAGGRYSPPDCIARHHVAIIISYRNRGLHLRILLNNLHPFLQKQQLDYGIFVIEQVEGSTFNRAMLMNIGFKEALSIHNYSCFIFHDVDHIPENDNNIYSCSGNPRHMAVAVDKFGYRMPYPKYFGGVSSLSRKEMEIVNGFSNKYFGWGGEDDDMLRRILAKNLTLVRHSPDIGRYRTIKHKRDKGNERSGVGLTKIKEAVSLMDKDGLNSLKYTRIKLINRKIYTWILVKINQSEVLNT